MYQKLYNFLNNINYQKYKKNYQKYQKLSKISENLIIIYLLRFYLDFGKLIETI